MIYPYNGILCSLKKEGNSDTSYNTEELKGHYAERNKSNREGNNVWFNLYEVLRVVKIKGSTLTVIARTEGRGEWGVSISWYRFSVEEDENVPEKDGGDDCTTMRMYLMPLNCMFKNG